MSTEQNQSFGVFKPVGHLVISFPTAAQAIQASLALERTGLSLRAIQRLTDRQMLEQIDRDIQRASPLAAVGQEMNLIKAHRELAERGFHWLIVRVDENQARPVADCVRRFGAERAQLYGHFVIEELIEQPLESQVAESPDRGLDAQTPSGHEADRRPKAL